MIESVSAADPKAGVTVSKPSNTLLRYREAIESCFPDLVVASVAPAGEGMDNVAVTVTVNDEYVFRFPKIEKAATKVALEAALLPELQKGIDLRIPCPELVGTDPRTGLRFSGYRRIDGVPLEPEVLFGLDPAVQASLMEQIVRFIRQMHSFPVDRATRLGLQSNDYEAEYAGDLWQTRELVYPMLDQRERDYVGRLYEGYLGDVRNFDYEPTVLHADLSPEHIILDPATQAIVGVIDSGDMVIGDPDYELHWLYASYRDELLRRYLAHNPHPCPERLVRKLRFFHRSQTVVDALIGVRRDDREILQSSLAELRRQAQQP